MCLRVVFDMIKPAVNALDVRADGYIWLWKVFDIDEDDNLIAQFNKYSFYEGKNTAKGKIVKEFDGIKSDTQYEPGFHCFVYEGDAHDWKHTSRNDRGRERIVVPIKVRKSWITAYGTQSRCDVIVCKHIII